MKKVYPISTRTKFQSLFFFSLMALAGAATANDTGAYYFELCNNSLAGGSTIPFSGDLAHAQFRSECAPDVLYTWMNSKEFDWKKFESTPLAANPYMYTWRTPLGSTGYGDAQIRLKLKHGIQFKWIADSIKSEARNCNLYPQTERDTTIYVAAMWNFSHTMSFSEYIICSPEVVESWSARTAGAALESNREHEFIKRVYDESIQTYDVYMGFDDQRRHVFRSSTGQNYIMENAGFRLVDNLELLDKIENESQGRIFSSRKEWQTPKRHFHTDVKAPFVLKTSDIEKL